MDINEKTEVIEGTAQAVQRGVEFMSNVVNYMDLCYDQNAPSIVTEVKEYHDGYLQAINRGARIRVITQITKENVQHCKKLTKLVSELRHLDDIKGGLAVSESEYMASAAHLVKGKPLTKVIYSNVKILVDQNRYLFESLWNKAISAESKIKEIEENSIVEKIDIIRDIANIQRSLIEFQLKSKTRLDFYGDSLLPSIISNIKGHRKRFLDLARRGVRTRFIMDIDRLNFRSCQHMTQIGEVRHLDGAKGNFAVSDMEYIAIAVVRESKLNQQAIFGNIEQMVEQHQYLFETLWNKAIPLEQRKKEIKYGNARYETLVLESTESILRQLKNSINTSENISILSSTGALLFIQKRLISDLAALLSRSIAKGNCPVRLVCSVDQINKDLVRRFMKLGIEIKHIKEEPILSFFVSDKEFDATFDKIRFGNITSNFMIGNDPVQVKYYDSLFEEYWKKGIDAENAIRDIEEGVESGNIEIINDSKSSISRAWHMVAAAREEILILFATAKGFEVSLKSDITSYFRRSISYNKDIVIKLLVPSGMEINKLVGEVVTQFPTIQVRVTDSTMQTRIAITITDRKEMMLWETKNISKDNLYERVGVGTYSDSRSIVLSYVTIFEKLWKQTELYEKLQEHDKKQMEFINIAAHELRTPIHPILINSGALKRRMPADERIEIISRNAKKLQKLTSNILDITRIEGQSLVLNYEAINLAEVIRQTARDFKDHLIQGVDIAIDVNSDIIFQADRARLSQILSNLLSNAVKFTTKGSITIRAINTGDNILVSIKDSGMGIEPHMMTRLFTKFATVSNTGIGLGLYITKNLIEAHGGRIWAENNKDSIGACFSFILPCKIKNYNLYRSKKFAE